MMTLLAIIGAICVVFGISSALLAISLMLDYEPNTSRPSVRDRIALVILTPGLLLLALVITWDWAEYRELVHELYSLIVYGHDLRDGNWDD